MSNADSHNPPANVSGMAVTLTLVFSDESHRHAWMRRNGILGVRPGSDADYDIRKHNTNLVYTVGPEGERHGYPPPE